jgi:hypothetical protein
VSGGKSKATIAWPSAPLPEGVVFVTAEYLGRRWSLHKSTITRLRQNGVITGNKLGRGGRLFLYELVVVEAQLRAHFRRDRRFDSSIVYGSTARGTASSTIPRVS